METYKELRTVAESVGKFIEYWGFRNIHGRIWAVVFLAPKPISTLEIIERLQVSKGLVSRSINELIEYRLLVPMEKTAHGRHTYIASEDLGSVIHEVLRTRELKLLEQNLQSMKWLAENSPKDLDQHGVSPEKLTQLIKLTQEKEALLKAFIRKKFRTMADWIKFSKLARGFLKL